MRFTDEKYDQIKGYLERQYLKYQDWDSVRTNLVTAQSVEMLKFLEIVEIDFNLDDFNQLVEDLIAKEQENKVVKMGRRIKNNAFKPIAPSSTWMLYKNKLINQSWSHSSIEEIEQSSYEILRHLTMEDNKHYGVKGLVVGNVQSGKTANMAGLMAMAADNGFNFFIILSGMIENLRKQTANRLYNDLVVDNNDLAWTHLDKPSLRSPRPEHNLSNFSLGERDRNRYFTVCLKNSSRLEALINWLNSDPNKLRQMKVLVIDDEADQASVNTNKIGEEDPTRINGLIKRLINESEVKAMNYVAYTATPYANILNEATEESLYPKDFIMLLKQSGDYIGPKELFGTTEPNQIESIPIVRNIPDHDREEVMSLQGGTSYAGMPKSFQQAIQWFLITVASLRYQNYHKPISMLVHTSFKIDHHENIREAIEDYLYYFKNNYEQCIKEVKKLYENETIDFKQSSFLISMEDYSAKEKVPDYPSWEEVEKHLKRLTRFDPFVSPIMIGDQGEFKFNHGGLNLVTDNSKANGNVRLVYPEGKRDPAPAFIVVGGNTLSRGLTLEGLTTTFFLRTTAQADTLMQMARWFGYRKGYEIYPRVWLDYQAHDRYEFISQLNEEIKEEIEQYATLGLDPMHYAPRVKNSPNHQFLRITSSNKMQSARGVEFNFAGFNSQTIYFENNYKKLRENYDLTLKFLNNLPSPIIKDSAMIWRNIDTHIVKGFLERYHVCDLDIQMSNLPNLIGWIEENIKHLANWNIVYSSVGGFKKHTNQKWNVQGYWSKPSIRTKIDRGQDEIAYIKALRSPSDLLIDIEGNITSEEKKTAEIKKIESIRRKYEYGDVPQLIIYRLDRGVDLEHKHYKNLAASRRPLNFPEEPIGINIMIPGDSENVIGDYASYIATNLNYEIDEKEESFFRGEEE